MSPSLENAALNFASSQWRAVVVQLYTLESTVFKPRSVGWM